MADPATSTFWASWQHHDDGLLGDADVVGAEAAITWGRERAQVIRIRLATPTRRTSRRCEARAESASMAATGAATGWMVVSRRSTYASGFRLRRQQSSGCDLSGDQIHAA